MIHGTLASIEPEKSGSEADDASVAAHAALFRSALAALVISDGGPVGAVEVYSREQDAFGGGDTDTLTWIASGLGERVPLSAGATKRRLDTAQELARRLANEKWQLLQDKNAARELLAAVASQVRTPLVSILAFADILLMNEPRNLTERQMKQLKILKRNGRLLALLIDELTDLSAVETGILSQEPSDFEFRRLRRDLLENLTPIFQGLPQKLQLALPLDESPGEDARDQLA